MELLKAVSDTFIRLKQIEYRIVLSAGREKPLEEVHIDFQDEDLFHILGLQHLTDIELPKNKKTLLYDIKDGIITDEYLLNSEYFDNDKIGYNIRKRIEKSINLEDYMDSEDFTVSVYKLQHNNRTNIQADYLITCKQISLDEEYYIFIRQRKESDSYSIISCFPKEGVSYWGGKRYLMLKEKRVDNNILILFKHQNY